MAQSPKNDYASKNGSITKSPKWRVNVVPADPATWHSIDPSTLRGAIDAITRAGGAIMLSITADGGAYSIVVLHQNEKIKEYPHGKAACEDVLRELTEYFTDTLLS
jgi:hypothetical protein